MNAWMALGAAIVVGLAIAWSWRLLRGARRSGSVQSYGEVRKHLIDQLGDDEDAMQGSPPPRPADLDTRLPMSVYEELAALHPRSHEQGFDSTRMYKLWNQIISSIHDELHALDASGNEWFELLSPARRAVLLAEQLEAQVNNGGFDQFYLNSSGNGARWTPEALRLLGQDHLAALVERCNAAFDGKLDGTFDGPPRERGQRLAAMSELPDLVRDSWGRADDEFYSMPFPDGGLAIGVGLPFVLGHKNDFFR